jgi:hypothetical protein
VKKKAALTLLRLYRKYPGIVQNEWAERMISLMDDPDMGVTLSVTSLIMALAQDRPEEYKGSYIKAAQRLKRIVVDNEIAPDYLYYRVPCPWIQVKLLRLLQYYPPSRKSFLSTIWSFFLKLTPYRGQSRTGDHSSIPATDHDCGHGYTKECPAKQRSECHSLRGYQPPYSS